MRSRSGAPGNGDGRTLVCVVGDLEALEVTGERLVERVIEPLEAEVLVCGTGGGDVPLEASLPGCRVVDRCVYEAGAAPPANPPSDAETWREYLAIRGDWLGGLGRREGTGLHRLINAAMLHGRLRELEAQGAHYSRFVVTQADLLWLYWHPPLRLLDRRYVWLPTSGDSDGYPDLHAVCNRRDVGVYLGRYEQLVQRSARRYLLRETALSRQRHLKLHLDYHGTRIGRFASVAYRHGSSTWVQVRTRAASGGMGRFEYEGERHRAVLNAELLRRGKKWRALIRRGTGMARLFRRLASRL